MQYSKFFDSKKYKFFILFIVLVLLGQDLIIELPVLFHKLQAIRYKGITNGNIQSIKPRKVLKQTLSGNQLIVIGYDISYSFEVKGKSYFGKTYLPNGTTQYASIYSSLYREQYIPIRYDPKKPSNNTVDMPYKDIFLSM